MPAIPSEDARLTASSSPSGNAPGGAAGTAVGRVHGWDLLRGVCAFAVAVFHLLTWQKVADLHTLGFYGVYLFFVLSGASLTINYLGGFAAGVSLRGMGQFLFVRYMRLIPLFALLVLLSLPWKLKASGFTPDLLGKIVSNLTFTFGFGSPLTQSMIVGGWSLGIEFIFYLLFPVFLIPLAPGVRRVWAAVVFTALLALQFTWIGFTAARDAVSIPGLSAYHQVPAFAAYFFGGCVIGWLHQQGRFARPVSPVAGLLGVAALGSVFVLLNHADPAQVLWGWRGLTLCLLCFVLVWWAGQIRLRDFGERCARHVGDVTYGVYLIHPFVFFGLSFVVAPRVDWLPMASGRWDMALAIGTAVLVATGALAYASERWFEHPIRRWSTRFARQSAA
ncbi:MAG: acyltransferase [Burkholderiaceae bacterium]|nr:acyltransferase [Burkholderiaceae bacterium]